MRPTARRALGTFHVLCTILVVRVAGAQDLDVHADAVELDARSGRLGVRGHVWADAGPFHLTSDALHLTRSARGVHIDGDAELRFCPCLGTPFALSFSGATVAPPGDLMLRSPVARLYGVPFLWAPWFWLRSPARPGLLPPEIGWRASDGLFVGGGVHLPWRSGELDGGLDVRAGGYAQGGFATAATLVTPASSTKIAFDRHAYSLRGENGLAVDARGAIEEHRGTTFAWDADIVRGARGLYATTDLEAASRPWDRAAAEASARGDGMLVALSARGVGRRGGEGSGWDAGGPGLVLRAAGALGRAGAYDATADGAVWKTNGDSVGFGRLDAGAEVATRMGPVGARLASRVGGAASARGTAYGLDGAIATRAALTLPLARGFGDGADPVRHRIDPEIAVGGVSGRDEGVLLFGTGRGASAVAGTVAVPEVGLKTSLGRWASGAGIELGAHAGALVDRLRARAALRWRAAASARLVAVVADGGYVAGEGYALGARARLGPTDGFSLRAHVEAREGIDPIPARALTDASTSVGAGFLSREGVSLGGRANAPIFPWLSVWAGADGDATAIELLDVVAGIELRDRCGCLGLRVTGSHRLGREGVDVWATIDVVPPRPR